MMLSGLKRIAWPSISSLRSLDEFSCSYESVLRHVVGVVSPGLLGQQAEVAMETCITAQRCPALARSMCTRRHLTDARSRYNDMEKCSVGYTSSGLSTEKTGRQLVLAVDKSEHSKYAVDWTLAHMYREGDKVQLVHCMNTLPRKFSFTIDAFQYATVGAPSVDDPGSTPALLTQQIDQLYGTKLAIAMIPYNITILGEDKDEAPFTEGVGDQVSAFADEIKASALVVASHRASDLSEFLLGSLSTFLVRYANQPVLVLHPPRGTAAAAVGADGPRDFVVAVDGSVMWALVVEWALNHIARPHDRIHIVQVIPKPRDVAQDVSFEASRVRVAELFERANVAHSFELMLHGADQVGSSVAAAVCSRCDELKATALVTASNRTGLLSGSVMDTVTSHCAQHCNATVVALH